jgi:hypothetical protein
MRRIRAGALLVIGLVAVAGCGGGSQSGESVSNTAARSPSGAPTAGAGGASSSGSGPAATGGTGAPSASRPSNPTSVARTGAGSEPVLTWNGLGDAALRDPAPAFAKALRDRLRPLSATDRQVLAGHGCVVRRLEGEEGLTLMVIGADPEGPVQVIGLSAGSRIRTSAGIGMGDSLDEVRQAYGAFLIDEAFDFWPEDGHALTAQAAGGARWVFIADHRNRIVEIRLGLKPPVYYPEGCV